MSVPPHRREGPMSEDLRDFGRRRSAHRQIRGRGMAQIMEPEVLELRLFDRLVPYLLDSRRLRAPAAREDEIAIDPPHLAELAQRIQGRADDGEGSAVAVFGLLQADDAVLEIDGAPTEAEDLAAAGAGRDGE